MENVFNTQFFWGLLLFLAVLLYVQGIWFPFLKILTYLGVP